MDKPYKLNICHLYYDLMNLYGDRGNVITLQKRCEWRNIDVNVSRITTFDEFKADDYDIVFIGGGQDYEQEIIQEDLLTRKADELKKAVEQDVVFLCICGGYQLMGKYYKTSAGNQIELLGALDLWTIAGNKRMIGNFVFECDFLNDAARSNVSAVDTPDSASEIKSNLDQSKIVGFENHSGRTYLGKGIKPLGKVIVGNGNNGEDGYEGAIYRNVYCSYSHGSLLPKNPLLADHLIRLALKRKYPDQFTELESLDDDAENLAHMVMLGRLSN